MAVSHNIIARTGHRSVESIQPYIGHQTADQKRNESGVLVAALGAPQSSSSKPTSAVQQSTTTVQQSTSIASQSTSVAQQSTTVQQSTASKSTIEMATPLRAGIPMMPSGTFQNCTFNFNI